MHLIDIFNHFVLIFIALAYKLQPMKSLKPTFQKMGSLVCHFSGHKYRVVKDVTHHFHEYECKCCGKQMTDDTKGRLIILTPERKEINETLHQLFQKRRQIAV